MSKYYEAYYCSKIGRLKEAALVYPENLGEGKLEGTKDNHLNYYIGCVYEAMGNAEAATGYFHAASVGTGEPAGMMYYNDQPADMILYQGFALKKLGKATSANAKFYKPGKLLPEPWSWIKII
ncbi:MAG: hypothetical protein WCD89_17375 [Anaerocolumna sp.]